MKVLVNLGESPLWRKSRGLALALRPVLEALTTADQLYLLQHKLPPLYELHAQGLVRYEEEPRNPDGSPRVEMFDAIPVGLARGWVDCDDAGPWRAAELRNSGLHAKIRIEWRKNIHGKMFHVLVRRPRNEVPFVDPTYMKVSKDGKSVFEDPSRKLGMGKHQAVMRRRQSTVAGDLHPFMQVGNVVTRSYHPLLKGF